MVSVIRSRGIWRIMLMRGVQLKSLTAISQVQQPLFFITVECIREGYEAKPLALGSFLLYAVIGCLSFGILTI
jgi:hypothetical protein